MDSAGSGARRPTHRAPVLLHVRRIWDRAPHSAFTDLTRFRGMWLCTFREAEGHAGDAGRLRVVASRDGSRWKSMALLSEPGVDLRDPKLSAAPGGRLMLVCGGTSTSAAAPGRRPRVSFSADGRRWTRLQPVLHDGDWLWRVTWLRGRAYGITYRLPGARRWTVTLVSSPDGVRYEEVCPLRVSGMPNEATIRFRPAGEATALVRREGGSRRAWIGASRPPYTRWTWREARHRLGGPNFIILPDGSAWAAGRRYGPGGAVTTIARMDARSLDPALDLPSGGDCSYPGLVVHRGRLWVSYYSSHEGRTCIYLAVLRLDPRGDR
jgi:hypothetical protein